MTKTFMEVLILALPPRWVVQWGSTVSAVMCTQKLSTIPITPLPTTPTDGQGNSDGCRGGGSRSQGEGGRTLNRSVGDGYFWNNRMDDS